VGRPIDLTGKRFGRLLVLAEAPRRSRQRYCLCRCDCPLKTEKEVSGGNLRNGEIRSCGCLRSEVSAAQAVRLSRANITIDLTGRRFGRLVVLREAPRRGRHRRWLCRCDCPFKTEKEVFGINLLSGDISSCGCLKKELVAARSLKHGMLRAGKVAQNTGRG
jgi:hypothetical protein